MKKLLIAIAVLGLLCAMNVQAAGPPLGLLLILLPLVAFYGAARGTTRWLSGFHRTMKKDGLW